MKANELRIGNYYDDNGVIRQVTPNVILEVWGAERIWCKPIPLTEEWLVKFGFEIESNRIYYTKKSKDFSISIYIGNGTLGFIIQNDDDAFHFNNKIKHVHQLQNLYFALTGEELTLNERRN